jgi:large subunit ribosomal protein L25
MDTTLIATTGRPTGSRNAGRLRAEGKIPGVVYGLGREPVALTVEWPELRRVLSGEKGLNALIDLDIDGHTELTLVKDMQRHPVRRNVIHVDFLRLDRDAPVAVDVPVVLTGFAKDVEDRRGIVDQQMKTLTVSAKPADIPTQFVANVDDLVIGGVITVGDIELPAGVTTDLDPGAPVVVGVGTRFTELVDHGADLDTPEGEEGAPAAEAEGDAED